MKAAFVITLSEDTVSATRVCELTTPLPWDEMRVLFTDMLNSSLESLLTETADDLSRQQIRLKAAEQAKEMQLQRKQQEEEAKRKQQAQTVKDNDGKTTTNNVKVQTVPAAKA